jgi:hypothetical protein
MNKTTSLLIEQINQKLKENPVFYISKDIERSIGLEKYLENYYRISIDDSFIRELLEKLKPGSTFSSKERGISLKSDTTLNLLHIPEVQDFIRSKVSNRFYAQFFQFTEPAKLLIEEWGGVVLNNPARTNRLFEGKISQSLFLKQIDVKTPDGFSGRLSDFTFDKLSKELSSEFVVQLEVSHTGLGTYFISSQEEFLQCSTKIGNSLVKISKVIRGDSYTINGCVTQNNVFVSGLQFQIVDIPDLSSSRGTTMGNDWSYTNINVSEDLKMRILTIMKKIGEGMRLKGFKGLFGIDLIISDDEIYVIEINARQTANISLQTQIELLYDQVPLIIMHLCEFMGIDTSFIESTKEIIPLEGSQIFLRSESDNFEIINELESGVYEFEENEGMKFLKDSYSFEEIGMSGFLLMGQKPAIKNRSDELARMQFRHGIIEQGKVDQKVLKSLILIKNLIKQNENRNNSQ